VTRGPRVAECWSVEATSPLAQAAAWPPWWVARGVLRTATVRHPGVEADAKTLEYLDRILGHLRRRRYERIGGCRASHHPRSDADPFDVS
jgi:hypothetical protein